MLMLASCSKESAKSDPFVNTVSNAKMQVSTTASHPPFGTWQAVSRFVSEGGPGSWQPVTDNINFTLLADSTYSYGGVLDVIGTGGTANIINDSTLFTVFSYGTPGQFPQPLPPNVFITGDTLYMPSFVSVEGGAFKFVKVKLEM
ncbi:hypothetical protein FLA_4670 [Filimonas lacunae]|nr:hypothetical protein FLA_4670 [Filimonas lacunae]